MSLPKPSAVRFEISVRARLPKGALALLRKEVITEAVERWLEDGEAPDGFVVRLTVWASNGKSRTIDTIDDSDRGERLRAVLRRSLKSGALQVRQVGTTK